MQPGISRPVVASLSEEYFYRRHFACLPTDRPTTPAAVVPFNFLFNLLSTLSSMLIIIYINSPHTTEAELISMFGDPCAPAAKAGMAPHHRTTP